MTTPGIPGIAPVSSSSSDGLVAAVSAMVSPSQPSPLVIQMTCTSEPLAALLARGELGRAASACAPGRRGDRRAVWRCTVRRAPGEAREVVLERAVQVPLVAAAGDEPGLGEARERVRDRRALGARRAAPAGGG